MALSEGLAPLQHWVKHLLDRVIAEDFGAADLEFAWDSPPDANPSATASIATDYVKSGIKSINEVRAELGLPPVAGGEEPKIQTAQGLMPLTQAPSATPAETAAKAGFDPDEPRDDHGMWTNDGGDGGGDATSTDANGKDSSDADAGASNAPAADGSPKQSRWPTASSTRPTQLSMPHRNKLRKTMMMRKAKPS